MITKTRLSRRLKMIVRILHWIFLTAPVLVIFLPGFHTTLAEDMIAGITLIYLSLRMLNDRRFTLCPNTAFLLNAFCLGLFYAMAWLGLVRGYYESYGKWLILFPVFLLLALLFRGQNKKPEPTVYPNVIQLWTGINLLIFIVLLLSGRVIHREANEYYQLTKHLLVPSLCVIPIISIAVLHARTFPLLQTGKQHLPIWLPLLLLSLMAWSGNAQTWAYWYTAGKLEREWTPYQFDKASQRKQYDEANTKPYKAVRYYNWVRQRLQHKGSLPQYGQWDFMLQYRMAYQARRLNDASNCLAFLPPSSLQKPSQISFIKQLWNTEFLTGMLHKNDMHHSPDLMFMDMEWDESRQQFLVMDLFGRVFHQTETEWEQVWAPHKQITNAVDLEITAHGITIAARDGVIYFEKENPYWKEVILPLPSPQRVADMEWIAPDACVVLTNYGQLHFVGSVPSVLPREQRFDFGKPFAADLELDPNQKGFYVLDVFGGIHSHYSESQPSLPHTSPMIDASLLPYWADQPVAIDLEIDTANCGLYVYNRMGEMYTIAAHPYRETYRPPKPAPFRGTSISRNKQGEIFALESNGGIIRLPH